MANYATLISAIQEVITENGNNEITGPILQQTLVSIINSLGSGYQFIGIATPSTTPGTPDQKVFYIGSAGTYPNFGPSVVPDGNLGVFYYDSDWHFGTVAFPLGDGSVTTSKIQDGAVTEEKLSNGVKEQMVHPVAVEPSRNDADLDISDSDGNILARFKDGHFRVKNFDSQKNNANLGIDSVPEFSTTQTYEAGETVQRDGLLYKFIVQHQPGAWNNNDVEQTNVMESAEHPVVVKDSDNDADLDISDDNNYILARFRNGHIRTKNFNSENLPIDYAQKDLDIFFNSVSEKQHYDTISATTKYLSFPYDLKKNICFALNAKFTSFATIIIGKGYNAYSGYWFVIDATTISLYYNQGSTVLSKSVTHGLTFSNFVKIIISNIGDDYCRFFIQTRTGQFSFAFDWIFAANGQAFVTASGTLTDVDFIASCSDLLNDIWVFGDSYLGFANPARWPKQLRNMGYSDYLGDGLAGQSSSGAYSDLQRCLSYNVKPKFLVWTLGMNDTDTAWNTVYQQLVTLCTQQEITLILATIPTVPSRNNEAKNTTIRNSGYQYIDFANAVGANSSGVWYSGYLSSDNVHPTELGAKALATQFIFDFLLKH